MTPFSRIEAAAARRKGGRAALEKLLPRPRSAAALSKTPDAVFLSAMAKQIFRAGFVWKIVDHKWPGLEEAFAGFDPDLVAFWSDRDLQDLVADPRVIRNREKIVAIRDDAAWMVRVAAAEGSFGSFLARWPVDDMVGLWDELQRQGKRLGGMTGPMFLREVGKDTFLLSPDVVKALKREKIVKGTPTAKRDLRAVQDAFNVWHDETGRPLCQLSRILACSVD